VPRGDRIVGGAPETNVTHIDDIVTGRNERPGHGTGQ